jgi:nucleotide-binding universal stress UspA family protein
MFHPQVILHPTDYSENSNQALQIAANLAHRYQAKIIVLHVAETLGPETVTFGEATSQLEPASYRHRLEEDLRQRVSAPAGVSVEYLLSEGDPAPEIQRVAQELQCDLIVMGTHSRTGLSRLFSSSTAEKVLRIASCPVLITKIHQLQPSARH